MNKNRHYLSSLTLLFVLCGAVSGCDKKETVLKMRHDYVEQFINSTNEQEICEILADELTFFDEQGATISVDGEADTYRIEFSENKSFEDSFYVLSDNSLIYTCGLIPGRTYFYRISDENKPGKYLKEGQVKTEAVPGVFYTVEGMHNVRDLGGWSAEGGKKIIR